MSHDTANCELCRWYVPQPYGRLLDGLWALLLNRLAERRRTDGRG